MASSGSKWLICPPTRLPNQPTKPTWLKPPARATRVANHTKVFQAARLSRMSFQLTMPVSSMPQMTTSPTSDADTRSPAKIHSSSAVTTMITSTISWRVSGPRFCSSPFAQSEISCPAFTSGAHSQ